jgi:iron complex transport system substrate-binding protein
LRRIRAAVEAGGTFRLVRRLGGVAALLAVAAASPAPAQSAGDAPARVVSINLCTDQLAMLVAAPGQLVSVSRWASRPGASNMAEAATGLRANEGGAEEVWLMKPDIVLAGTFNDPATLALLERLGLRVETFAPATSLDDVPERLRRIGRLLGREAAAARVVADFEAARARAASRARGLRRLPAAYHYPNGYTSGAGTLAADVMAAARLENAAAGLGLSGVAPLPLEALVMLEPFLIRTTSLSGARHGRAYETGGHPAMTALAAEGGARVEARRQACGTPFVTLAVEALLDARAPALAAAE